MMKKLCVLTLLLFAACALPCAAWAAGTPDTDWYNTTDAEFSISTADELAGLALIVNGTAGGGINQDSFEGNRSSSQQTST